MGSRCGHEPGPSWLLFPIVDIEPSETLSVTKGQSINFFIRLNTPYFYFDNVIAKPVYHTRARPAAFRVLLIHQILQHWLLLRDAREDHQANARSAGALGRLANKATRVFQDGSIRIKTAPVVPPWLHLETAAHPS